MYKYCAEFQLHSSYRSWDSNLTPWGGQQWPPLGGKGEGGANLKKNWNDMYKYLAKIQLRSSNRSWDNNLTPLRGQWWPPWGKGGSRGDPHKSDQLRLWHSRHIPNYKILAQAEAEIAISPLYSSVYSTKIGYTPTAPQGGLRGVTCKHQFEGSMGWLHTKNFRPLPITITKLHIITV